MGIVKKAVEAIKETVKVLDEVLPPLPPKPEKEEKPKDARFVRGLGERIGLAGIVAFTAVAALAGLAGCREGAVPKEAPVATCDEPQVWCHRGDPAERLDLYGKGGNR